MKRAIAESTCDAACAHHFEKKVLGAGEYIGATKLDRRFDQFRVNTVHHDEARALPRHGHDWAFISTLTRGSYCSDTRTSRYEFRKNEAVVHPQDFQHKDEVGDGGASFFCLQVAPGLIEELGDLGGRPVNDLIALREPVSYGLIAGAITAFSCLEDDLTCEALLYDLAAGICTEARKRRAAEPHWVSRTADHLRDAADEPLSLQQLADDAGVHQTTLSRVFRECRGRSIGTYRGQARANRAFFCLLRETKPLSEISLEAGYADQSHMCREVKRWFGVSPATVRDFAAM